MKKQTMSKRNIKRFTDQCFDRESEQAARIIKGVLDAQSPRISDIANAMDGKYDANYKAIQRFIEDDKPEEALHRLYNEESEYVLGDPTDIERPQAQAEDFPNQRSLVTSSGVRFHDFQKNCLWQCPNFCLNIRIFC